ncbi:retinol dehydrogenase 12 [Anabrus simplex]|uniref:retinol dehydrogenase 12 n=1 Tax=Anabrus simplex TaxID=316456 RepID=UPI0035A33D8B
MLEAVLIAVLSVAASMALYLRLKCGYCSCSRRLDGLTAIVTGANTGIGKETARHLAQLGARVILACRDMKKAEQAREEIVKSTGNTNVLSQQLDLSSLQSVREFAQRVVNSESRLHILVNNAGLGGSSKITGDGLELTMQVNHFGPFLLTVLLLDLLKKSAPARIIMVSSMLHTRGKLDLEDLGGTQRRLSYLQLYSNSKLCNVLTANELHRRLSNSGVTANSLHPGAVWTDVWRRLPTWQLRILRFLASVYFKNSVQGAQTTIHLAVSEDLQTASGQYFEDCKVSNPAPAALNEELAKKVWDLSLKCVGLES